jgi:polyvinyl alcohol dehydrogenase (cytochrome)
VRAAITISVSEGTWTAYVADQGANVYALNALTGALLWKTRVDDLPAAVITGAPTLAGLTLYVSTSSTEEGASVDAKYECCRFRGSVSALDAATAPSAGKAMSFPKSPSPRGRTRRACSCGVRLARQSGRRRPSISRHVVCT